MVFMNRYCSSTSSYSTCKLYSVYHKLINYTATNAFAGFSSKFICKKIFRHYYAILADEWVLICRQGDGGEARPGQDTKIAAESL
jgi:hypothetical protein